MDADKAYFFCGIGGSGMLPLALILKEKGASVSGSDRALDQGRTAQKFRFLRDRGIKLFPQDGSGVTRSDQTVVISAAVEESVPDVLAARRVQAPLVTRAELLAQLFNAAPLGIGIAGTSGKSTTTGMTGWILRETGLDPTIVNGAVMTNFATADIPFASAVEGKGLAFVSEVDESDGSIALYAPRIAVVNNMAIDHKSMDELRGLFSAFAMKAETAVLNLDNEETAALARSMSGRALTFALVGTGAHVLGHNLVPAPAGIAFEVREGGDHASVRLRVPGRHNVSNALAALAAARACGVALADAAAALESFKGIRRRLEVVGASNGITVIDDFAHNPDKIAATLSTLHDFPGRLLILFQPQGFGPLKLMRDDFIDVFSRGLGEPDVLFMTEPVYFGGTADRSVTSDDIVAGIRARKRIAHACGTRTACGESLLRLAKSGDRIVIMGARDDTLTQFAGEILAALA